MVKELKYTCKQEFGVYLCGSMVYVSLVYQTAGPEIEYCRDFLHQEQ